MAVGGRREHGREHDDAPGLAELGFVGDARCDADGNGALDMAEFATLMRATKQPTPSTAGGRTSPANKPRRPGARRQAQV